MKTQFLSLFCPTIVIFSFKLVINAMDPRQNQDQSVFQCTDTGNIGKRSFLGQPGANFENILREVLDRSVSKPGGLC